jgi:hypothetical protein
MFQNAEGIWLPLLPNTRFFKRLLRSATVDKD